MSEGEVRFIKSENIVEGEITNKPKEFIVKKPTKDLGRLEISMSFVIAGASLGKTDCSKKTYRARQCLL